MGNPDQTRDEHGRWSAGGGPAAATTASVARYPVAPHNGRKSIGTHSIGPGFTLSKRTGVQPTSGFAVAGADASAKHIGGGGGWATEHVNVVRGEPLAKSLARKRGEQAYFDLGRKQTLTTPGKSRQSIGAPHGK